MLRTRVAVLLARTSVSQVEKAGDAARFRSCCLLSSSRTEMHGEGARGSCALWYSSCAVRLGVCALCRGGESKIGMLACGGVLTACELATYARGGATIADDGAIVLEGETGTELTWMTSS